MPHPAFVRYGFTSEPWGQHPLLIRQRHGANVVEAPRAAEGDPPIADAVWTSRFEREVYCFTADCVPLLIYGSDPWEPVATVHAGWRGVLAGVVERAITALGVPRERLHVIVGPSIKGCCYEVKSDFVAAFQRHGHDLDGQLFHRDGRMYFDLPSFVIRGPLAGIPTSRVSTSYNRCTACSAEGWPSRRRDGTSRRHIRAWILKVPAAPLPEEMA